MTSSPPTRHPVTSRALRVDRQLAELEAERQAARAARPRVFPHPAAIASFVANLAETLEAEDVTAAGDLLRTVLAPFQMLPQADGRFRLVGAINLGVRLIWRVAGA
jgi:hypothetical protein